MTDIVRLALFVLSLDLILGYAGIVSLGHAAFFGVGAYSAGLLACRLVSNRCWAWLWRAWWRPASASSRASWCARRRLARSW